MVARVRACVVTALVATMVVSAGPASAQTTPRSFSVTRETPDDLRTADQVVDQMVRTRDLRVRESMRDALLPTRQHERLDQYHRGVRIVGGDLTRQTAPDGTVSIFGMLHADLDIETTPGLSVDAASTAISTAVEGEPLGDRPELVVLPLSDGYHLAYRGQASVGAELVNVFVDATTGRLLQQFSDFDRDIGSGKGAYGDAKKVSAKGASGAFLTDDPLRPAPITTYDMKGDFARITALLNRVAPVLPSDIASDSDNVWTDSNVVDAHVYAGWYYDYLSKRFGRNGLDNRNVRMAIFTHPVRLQDASTASADVFGLYYLNSFYCRTCLTDGRGAIVLGEGVPLNFFRGIDVKPFSAALDVVAHELTHGVTANTAGLNGFTFSEAGALNEGFSDIFGISTAFYYEPAGSAPLTAGYLQGRDLTVPSGLLSRSLSNPHSTFNPDHYTQRIIGGDSHYNSTILSHSFYLAIEGGTNATSRLSVQGVGASSREQIEKAYFRALTTLLPSSATFALARATTIQAAVDLYGASGAAVRAITQAWDAVGVQPRVAPTAALMPSPATSSPSTAASCGVDPSWILGVTLSAGSSNLRITGWSSDDFNSAGTSIDHTNYTTASFAGQFTACGPGSTTILAQTDACLATCWILNPGVKTGSTQVNFTALDDAGRTVTFSTPRVTLK